MTISVFTEKMSCFCRVRLDLGLQLLQGIKFLFRTEKFVKFQSDLPAIKVAFKLQQPGFHRNMVSFHRRAGAHIGHCRINFAVHHRFAAVHAKSWGQDPIRQNAQNAGVDGSVVFEKIKNSKKIGYGYNAYTETYMDMIENGIVDPTKVTRSSLENAASISACVLTTESLVADKPNPEADAAAMAAAAQGGGMY